MSRRSCPLPVIWIDDRVSHGSRTNIPDEHFNNPPRLPSEWESLILIRKELEHGQALSMMTWISTSHESSPRIRTARPTVVSFFSETGAQVSRSQAGFSIRVNG